MNVLNSTHCLVDSSNSTSSGGTRSGIQIAWSCIAIIFACTWTAIHPNVPPPPSSSSSSHSSSSSSSAAGGRTNLKWRRIRMTLWALLVPELMVQWAILQWLDARSISKAHPAAHIRRPEAWGPPGKSRTQTQQKYERVALVEEGAFPRGGGGRGGGGGDGNENGNGKRYNKEYPWTRVHSFFLAMGGFAISLPPSPALASDFDSSDGEWRPIRLADLTPSSSSSSSLRPITSSSSTSFPPSSSTTTTPIPWPNLSQSLISDKSKGDAVAKTLVITQLTWFAAQLTWFAAQLLARAVQRCAITELEVMTLAYVLLCGVLYFCWWDKPYDVLEPIFVKSATQYQDQDHQQHHQQHQHHSHHQHQHQHLHHQHRQRPRQPSRSNTTPTNPTTKPVWSGKLGFGEIVSGDWIFALHGRIIEEPRLDSLSRVLSTDAPRSSKLASIAALVGATVFGVVHCIPWILQSSSSSPSSSSSSSTGVNDFHFPTHLERLLWTTSSTIVAGAPLAWVLVVITADSLLSLIQAGLFSSLASVVMGAVYILGSVLTYSYFVCRLVLIVLAFGLLRRLEGSVGRSVSWAAWFPHI